MVKMERRGFIFCFLSTILVVNMNRFYKGLQYKVGKGDSIDAYD